MTFSLKKLFKKDQDTPQQHKPAELAKEVKPAESNTTQKPKHGDEGVCCGSCS